MQTYPIPRASCFPRKSDRASKAQLIAAALGFAVPAYQAMAAPIAREDALDSPMLAYSFDSKLLMGSQLGVANIERFNQASDVDPGSYRVDIHVNDTFVARQSIEFIGTGKGEVYPCLNNSLLASFGALVEDDASDAASTAAPGRCVPLPQRIAGATTKFDMPNLRLDISIPQARMKQVPRGAIDSGDLDAGQTAAYVNYDTNYYTASSYGAQMHSLYAGINAGINLGLWRVRQQSAYTYGHSAAGSNSRWNAIRTYAERPLPAWNSQLTIGQSFTGGSLLSAIGYTGVRIETDDRMLPDSVRGYAPVVRGIANTNARVVVSQNGGTIYQTTVAPGPFAITDLNPTSYQGDLSVEVFEANGQVSRFTVPFSAVPGSMRPGVSHASLTLGQVRQIENSTARFIDLTYQRGLTNAITANGAARFARGYQSLLGGFVLGTRAGAFGTNLTWSGTRDAQGGWINGWVGSLTYSYTIEPTQTSFSLAGYRYSTKGYRDFTDALGARAAYQSGKTWSSTTYQQRDQFTVNVSQSLGQYGFLALSTATSRYYGATPRDTQLQLSYNNHYRSISYNVSFVRQSTTQFVESGIAAIPGLPGSGAQASPSRRMSNTLMLTISVPLGSGPRSASASGGMSRDPGGRVSYQASVSGIADEAQTLSYGLAASGRTQEGLQTVSANVQKNLSMITTNASASRGRNFWQAGASARGALVAHRGGVTPGPYLSDTFGIVEAKGAEGAMVRNGMGARINRFGYAIIPALTPYRYTDVALDSKGINRNAELTGNQARVAPYAGAAVLLKFSTLIGHAVMISADTPEGAPLPMGANVLDSAGASIGMVGQGGLAYARIPAGSGDLTVKWGERSDERCALRYDLPKQDAKTVITRIKASCRPVQAPAAQFHDTARR